MAKVEPRYCHLAIDDKIYRNRYYVYTYDEKLNQYIIPISWYSRKLAKLVLSSCFGLEVLKTLFIIKGSKAIREKIPLGKNSFLYQGKKRKVKKYYIPPEWDKDKHSRRHFLLRLYRCKGDVEKKYFFLVYGNSEKRTLL